MSDVAESLILPGYTRSCPAFETDPQTIRYEAAARVKGRLRGKRRPYTYRVARERVNVAVAVDARVQVRAGKVADESRLDPRKERNTRTVREIGCSHKSGLKPGVDGLKFPTSENRRVLRCVSFFQCFSVINPKKRVFENHYHFWQTDRSVISR